MKIEAYENHDGSKLVAYLVKDDGSERELVRSEKGSDDLLNKIDDMGLSYLTITFHWASKRIKSDSQAEGHQSTESAQAQAGGREMGLDLSHE